MRIFPVAGRRFDAEKPGPRPVYRYSIIACARWETPYIAEWIAYYAAIGFERIYLYCNDDDPAELRAAVEAATVRLPDLVVFTHFAGQGLQRDMYLAGLERARAESEWVTFLDIDEFLNLRGCKTIGQFMQKYPGADSVHFNWIYFGNNGFVERPAGSVLSQYTWRADWVHVNTKHLTRVKHLDAARVQQHAHPFWHGLADPVWSTVKRVNVLGDDIAAQLVDFPAQAEAYLADPAVNAAILHTAVINHYAFKSEKDFLFRVQRGTGGEFASQTVWKERYDTGDYRQVLDSMHRVEDTDLRDFSVLALGQPAPPPPPSGPTGATRSLRVRHHRWVDDLLLGDNGRLRHASHGSLASYYLCDDVLHVRWDDWPSDLFLKRNDVYTSLLVPGWQPLNMRVPLTAEVMALELSVEAVVVRLPGGRGAVEVRPGTTDVDVFGAIFLAREYMHPVPPGPVRCVFDLGANTGLSSVFFAQTYPDALVVAVEPEAGNARLLERHAQAWPDIVPVQAAIWPEDTRVHLQTHDDSGKPLDAWAFRTSEALAADDANVDGLSIPTLMRRFNVETIDLVKVDIEGAELELFTRGTEAWLDKVRCLVVKTHERFRPGVDAALTACLADHFEELLGTAHYRAFLRRS